MPILLQDSVCRVRHDFHGLLINEDFMEYRIARLRSNDDVMNSVQDNLRPMTQFEVH
jgi:hypothetical protein